MSLCCTLNNISNSTTARTEIAKFGSRRDVSVDSGVCNKASIGSCALAVLAASSASRAGKARVVAEHGIGERRASHLRTQCEQLLRYQIKQVRINHQLSSAGCVAQASLSRGAEEAVAAINDGRGDGGEGGGTAQEYEREHKNCGTCHCERSMGHMESVFALLRGKQVGLLPCMLPLSYCTQRAAPACSSCCRQQQQQQVLPALTPHTEKKLYIYIYVPALLLFLISRGILHTSISGKRGLIFHTLTASHFKLHVQLHKR